MGKPVAIDAQHLAQAFFREIRRVKNVSRRFDNDLMGADAGGHVKQIAALGRHVRRLGAQTVRPIFKFKGGILVGHDANSPAPAVGGGAWLSPGGDFAGRLVFAPFAEGTCHGDAGTRRGLKLVGSVGSVLGDDYPAVDDRVFTQFGHRGVYVLTVCLSLAIVFR